MSLTTLLHRPEPAPWHPGDVPVRAAGAELVDDPYQPAVQTPHGELRVLSQLGHDLWPLIDGRRSAPSLARDLSERHGAPLLDTAVAVHSELELLAAAGLVRWA